jgi:hypothetical protein
MKSKDLPATNDVPSQTFQLPQVVAHFSGYKPPFDPVPIVERMLASVPPKYLVGLSEVVLTNSSGLSREMRRSVTKSRGRKVRVAEARGLYRQAWNGKPAWIQIFVDNTLSGREKGWWLKLSLQREVSLASVLFHEVGHHIHYTTRPEFREKEDVADSWMRKLRKNYLRRRYAWLIPFIPFLRIIGERLAGSGKSKTMTGE